MLLTRMELPKARLFIDEKIVMDRAIVLSRFLRAVILKVQSIRKEKLYPQSLEHCLIVHALSSFFDVRVNDVIEWVSKRRYPLLSLDGWRRDTQAW